MTRCNTNTLIAEVWLPKIFLNAILFFDVLESTYSFLIKRKITPTLSTLENLFISIGGDNNFDVKALEGLAAIDPHITICSGVLSFLSYPAASKTHRAQRRKSIMVAMTKYIQQQYEASYEGTYRWVDVLKWGWPVDFDKETIIFPIRTTEEQEAGLLVTSTDHSLTDVISDHNFEEETSLLFKNSSDLTNVLDFLSRYRDVDVITSIAHIERIPARPPSYCPLDGSVCASPALLRALVSNKKIPHLYSHQRIAIEAITKGEHVVVSTSTSSGKSLIYNIPILDHVLRDNNVSALYMFPTKALAQDQLHSLHALCGTKHTALAQTGTEAGKREGSQGTTRLPVTIACCDGDTSFSERANLRRDSVNILLSNPDMMHHSVLPDHKAWAKFLCNLRYVVIDEAHVYSGAFGSHVSCVLKRLWRLCAFYQRKRHDSAISNDRGHTFLSTYTTSAPTLISSQPDEIRRENAGRSLVFGPQFILCSATLPDPAIHARLLLPSLNPTQAQPNCRSHPHPQTNCITSGTEGNVNLGCGRALCVVDELMDGSPHGERAFVLWNNNDNTNLSSNNSSSTSAADDQDAHFGSMPGEDNINDSLHQYDLSAGKRDSENEALSNVSLDISDSLHSSGSGGDNITRLQKQQHVFGLLKAIESSSSNNNEHLIGNGNDSFDLDDDDDDLPLSMFLAGCVSRPETIGMPYYDAMKAADAVSMSTTAAQSLSLSAAGVTYSGGWRRRVRPLSSSSITTTTFVAAAVEESAPVKYNRYNRYNRPKRKRTAEVGAPSLETKTISNSESSSSSSMREENGLGCCVEVPVGRSAGRPRSPIREMAALLVMFIRKNVRTIAFCQSRNVVELVYDRALKELAVKDPQLVDRLACYRGGYTASNRRSIEARLFSGDLLGVVSTSALELGVDIGSLDVSLHLGYPGSHSALWQQAGRVGRSGRPSLSIVVCRDASPIDQYFARHPDALFHSRRSSCNRSSRSSCVTNNTAEGGDVSANSGAVLAARDGERGGGGPGERETIGSTVNPWNVSILAAHLLCAAAELPLAHQALDKIIGSGATCERADDETDADLWGPKYHRLLRLLCREGALIPCQSHSRSYRYRPSPSLSANISLTRAVNLRLADDVVIQIVVAEEGSTDCLFRRPSSNALSSSSSSVRTIDSIGYSKAIHQVFEGAVLIHQGRRYVVKKLDMSGCVAFCKPTDVPYYTSSICGTSIVVTRQHTHVFSLSSDVPAAAAAAKRVDGKKGESAKETGYGDIFHSGNVLVTTKLNGYRKHRLSTGEVFEKGDCSLPPVQFQTTAMWFDIPVDTIQQLAGFKARGFTEKSGACTSGAVPFGGAPSGAPARDEVGIRKRLGEVVREGGNSRIGGSGGNIAASIHCANHVLLHAATLLTGCDVGDVEAEHPAALSASSRVPHRCLLYDTHPGGMGISTSLKKLGLAPLVGAALGILEECPCHLNSLILVNQSAGGSRSNNNSTYCATGGGCPSCTFWGKCPHFNESQSLHKAGAILLLRSLLQSCCGRGFSDAPSSCCEDTMIPAVVDSGGKLPSSLSDERSRIEDDCSSGDGIVPLPLLGSRSFQDPHKLGVRVLPLAPWTDCLPNVRSDCDLAT